MLRGFLTAIMFFFCLCSCSTSDCRKSSDTSETSHRETEAETPQQEAYSSVVIRVEGRAQVEGFVGYARYWTENLTIERRVGEGWEDFSYEQPLCSEPCPRDDSTPTCRFCSPPAPSPTVRRVDSLEYNWYGFLYESRQVPNEWCSCYRQVAAPLGRYRVSLRIVPEVTCESSPCSFNEDGEAAGTAAAEEVTITTEFELTETDQTVTLEVNQAYEVPPQT